MNKEETLKRIKVLEKEVQELRKLVESSEQEVKVWEDLKNVGGYYITTNSHIQYLEISYVESCNRNNFLTEKQAKSALAMAQISQLMPYYGGEITDKEWDDNNIVKYVIKRMYNRIDLDNYYTIYHFLAFHTLEQRDEFLKNNERLVKDYLMID